MKDNRSRHTHFSFELKGKPFESREGAENNS
jgi:hypothetical protein